MTQNPPETGALEQTIAPGYTFEGAALELGGLMLDATTLGSTSIRIPLAMLNRHGLVAGATGTGKTKTLQLLAEQLSAQGVPVFAADIKGDLSGLATPGAGGDKITARASSVGQQWTATGFPVEYYAIGGEGTGIPLRVTMSAFGPTLLSKVLGLNDTQESSLGLVFHYADQAGLPLLDLADLRAFASTQLGLADPQPWDWSYVGEKLKEARYAFSEPEVKQYFTAPKVLAGLFKIVETLFDVEIREDSAPVWNAGVKFYRIERRN
eukprot:gene32992-37268_t